MKKVRVMVRGDLVPEGSVYKLAVSKELWWIVFHDEKAASMFKVAAAAQPDWELVP